MMMLEFLETRIADISGVTPQRKGAIENRETVGGVERSVMQSSNNTEKYFSLHDNFRLRCLKTIVETAKIAWKDKKEKRMFVLDDGTKTVLDFDGDSFKQGVYGIATSSSSDATNMMNDLKGLSQHFMQNGGSMSAIIDIYQTKDPTSLKRKMEQYDEDIQQRQKETEDKQLQAQQEQIASAERMRQEEMNHEKELKQMEIDGKLQLELVKNDITPEDDNTLDVEKLNNDKSKADTDAKLKRDQLNETKRHNIATEQISRQKPKSANK